MSYFKSQRHFLTGLACVTATVLVFVAGFTAMDAGYRPVVGARARGELAPRARRPGGDTQDVPTPADPATQPRTIKIVVEEAPPRSAPSKTVAVVYTASWCSQCYKLEPAIAAARERGARVEVRDIDNKTPGDGAVVRLVPTTYLFRDGVLIDRVEGVAASIATLEKLP